MSSLPILEIDRGVFKLVGKNFNSVLSKVGDRPFALISMNGPNQRYYALDYCLQYLTFQTKNENPRSSSSVASSTAESWMEGNFKPRFPPIVKNMGGNLYFFVQPPDFILYLWSEPFILKVDGREVAVLLMDCRGLFDERKARQSAIAFSLISLCSTTCIFYQQNCKVDESILQQIQFFSGKDPFVFEQQTKENFGIGGPDDKHQHGETNRQKQIPCKGLIFLCPLSLEPSSHYRYGYHGNDKNGSANEIDGINYFRDNFNSVKVKRPREDVFIRQEILGSYKDVGCFLMPRPEYQKIGGEFEQTNEHFCKHMKEFMELIFSPKNLMTKKIHGVEITGNNFKRFVSEWAKLLDNVDDHFPASLEHPGVIQNTLAFNAAWAHYEKAMTLFFQAFPCGTLDSELDKHHEKVKREAFLVFFNIRENLDEDETPQQYQSALLERIEESYEIYRQQNLTLLSNTATEEELAGNKLQTSEIQQEMSPPDLELKIQNQGEKEEQESKIIGNLHKKSKEDSKPNEEQLRIYKEQLNLAEAKYAEVTEAAEENKRILMEQMERAEAQHQEALEKYRREIENLKAASQTPSSSDFQPAATGSVGSGTEQRDPYDCKNMRVLFINQKFDSPGKSNEEEYTEKKRDGADADGLNVTNLFEKTLGMKLDLEENVASDEISAILKRFKRKCIGDGNDGCIVIISTHGIDPHFLLMDDLKLINLEKLVIQKFGRDEFPEFNGKPKIFLFNACRIERTNVRQIPEFIEEDSTSVFSYSDILIGKSTLPLFPSYRHAKEGSFYLKYLYDVCTENTGKKLEIQDLLNSVGRKVAEELEKFGNKVQIPPIELRLFTKNLYLKPKNSS